MKKTLTALLIAGALVSLTGCGQMNREQHSACKVEDKDRAIDSSGNSSYRVYSDCGVFEVADDMIEGQWNAADTYSKIDVGETYNFETIGWRNGFLSLFPNIVKVGAA